MMLNIKSPIPLYRQLSDIILEGIRNRKYLPGSRIPSELSLAKQYGVGRPTVRQATDFLERKQILTRKRGSGTYVHEKKQEVDLLSIAGTISSFQKKGVNVFTKISKPIGLILVKKNFENPFYNKEAYYFSRISYADEIPALLEDIYLDPDVFKDIDRIDLTNRSLSQIVEEKYYLRPSGAKQNFKIAYLAKKNSRLLCISPEVPVLAVNRFIHFSDMENAIYSDIFCRTERFVFSQTLKGFDNE